MAKRPAKAKRKIKRGAKFKPEPGLRLGLRRIPWDELTPEERRNMEGLAREEERWRRQREERAKTQPWLTIDIAQAGKKLDRAAALEKWGRPQPSPLPPKEKQKKAAALGRPAYPSHVKEGVEKVARQISFISKFLSFWKAVRDECRAKNLITPGEKYMQDWTRPIHRRRRAALASSRKAKRKNRQKSKK